MEPIVAIGTRRAAARDDGWTLASADGSLTAHHEQTIVITEAGRLVLTAA